MKALCPDVCKDRITEIDSGLLTSLGVKGVILDLDNTLGGYDDPLPPPEVVSWVSEIRRAGFSAYLVSNNSHKKRVSAYAQVLGIGWMHFAAKPLTGKVRRAAKLLGLKRREICLIGDQVFTDVLAGKWAGAKTILVTSVEKWKKRGE